MSWTPERIELARQLYIVEGRAASAVAAIVGDVSRNAVMGLAHRRGWKHSPLVGAANMASVPLRAPAVKPLDVRTLAADGAQIGRRAMAVSSDGRNAYVKTAQAVTIAPPRETLTATMTLMQLGRRDCRWPIGDPRDGDFGFCGRPKAFVEGAHSVYCATRHWRSGTWVKEPSVPDVPFGSFASATEFLTDVEIAAGDLPAADRAA